MRSAAHEPIGPVVTPDLLDVTGNGPATNTSWTLSAVDLALFAFLTSWVVHRYAFRDSPR